MDFQDLTTRTAPEKCYKKRYSVSSWMEGLKEGGVRACWWASLLCTKYYGDLVRVLVRAVDGCLLALLHLEKNLCWRPDKPSFVLYPWQAGSLWVPHMYLPVSERALPFPTIRLWSLPSVPLMANFQHDIFADLHAMLPIYVHSRSLSKISCKTFINSYRTHNNTTATLRC